MKYAPRVMQEIKTTSVSTESLVSNEGLLDAFVKFIKGYNKDSPGDEKDGEKIYSFRWLKLQEKEINDTFGREGWVKANYHETPTQLPKEFAALLSYKGRVLKPAEGLTKGLELVKNFLKKVSPGLTTYRNALHGLEETALKRIKAGEDPVAVAKDTLKKAKVIPLPIDKKFVYEDVIGEYAISRMQSPKRKGGEMVPLSLEDVIAGGEEIATMSKEIAELFSLPVHIGSGCDTDLWTYPGFDYNHSDEDLAYLAEQLHDYFYFQNVPETQEKVQYDAIFGYAEYAREVGRWLQAYTR